MKIAIVYAHRAPASLLDATFAGGSSASAPGGQEDDRQGRAAALGRSLSDRSTHLNCFIGAPQADASDVPVISHLNYCT